MIISSVSSAFLFLRYHTRIFASVLKSFIFATILNIILRYLPVVPGTSTRVPNVVHYSGIVAYYDTTPVGIRVLVLSGAGGLD